MSVARSGERVLGSADAQLGGAGGPGSPALRRLGLLGDVDLLGTGGLVRGGGVLAAPEGLPGGAGELQSPWYPLPVLIDQSPPDSHWARRSHTEPSETDGAEAPGVPERAEMREDWPERERSDESESEPSESELPESERAEAELTQPELPVTEASQAEPHAGG